LHKIVPIVEGEGEIDAVPKLIYKILRHLGRHDFVVTDGKNAGGSSNLKKQADLTRLLRAAERESGIIGSLILIDADDDCPMTLATEIVQLVKQISVRYSVVVVVANREYEAWLIASLPTIRGNQEIDANSIYSGDVEARRGAKEWITNQMQGSRKYNPIVDQVILTQKIDVDLAVANSRSFRRLVHAIELLVDAADTNAATISP